jgi:hypothetical protein
MGLTSIQADPPTASLVHHSATVPGNNRDGGNSARLPRLDGTFKFGLATIFAGPYLRTSTTTERPGTRYERERTTGAWLS